MRATMFIGGNGLRTFPQANLAAVSTSPAKGAAFAGEQKAGLGMRVVWRRGWDSNPRTPVKMLLEFQSSAFDRSATSPINGLQPSRLQRAANDNSCRPRAHPAPGVEAQACGAFATL